MPGPTTEVLNDDHKEMRADIHRAEVALMTAVHQGDATLATEISRGDAALATEIGRVATSLTAEISRVATALSTEISKIHTSLSAEIYKVNIAVEKLSIEFAVFRWLIGLTLVALLSGLGMSIWWAATVTNRVGTLESKSAQDQAYRQEVTARFDRLDASIKAISRAASGGAANPPTSQPQDKP